jgi:hypothetical protein
MTTSNICLNGAAKKKSLKNKQNATEETEG